MDARAASALQGDLQDQQTIGYESPLGLTRTQIVTLPGITTESGRVLKHLEVACQTLGVLSPARDNAILVCHGLSGSAHLAGLDPVTGKPGWWDYHVGPGKAIDTDRYFVISTNCLGSCNGTTGPGSIDPATHQRYGLDFPRISIRDMVRVQAALLDHFKIESLHAVVGASMGGMQALTWAVDFPERVRACIPIATCTAHNAMQIAFNEIGRQAIMADALWLSGKYSEAEFPAQGLAVARMVGHVTYLSETAMSRKFGRRRQAESPGENPFSVENYLHHQGSSFVKRFDPNSYIYLTRAIDEFDLLGDRSPEQVLQPVQARFLVISFSSDWLYPPGQSRALVRWLKRAGKAATYANLDTDYGHDSFLIENPPMAELIRNFLHADQSRRNRHPEIQIQI